MILKTTEIKNFKHLEVVLGYTRADMEQIANHSADYYRTFETKQLKGEKIKIRKITEATGQLRILQKRILHRILTKIPLLPVVMGGVAGRDNISNAKCHQGNKYILQTDIKNFFPSISNKQVFEMFLQNGFSSTVASLLTKLTTFENCVPQGASTSTQIANLVFTPVDTLLIQYCYELEIMYTRFVDDLAFSSKNDIQNHIQNLFNIILLENFKISRKKTTYTTGITVITGVEVGNNGLTITEDLKQKIKNDNDPFSKQLKGRLMYAKRVNQISQLAKRQIINKLSLTVQKESLS
jgi:RNA-directed DNA polymerase